MRLVHLLLQLLLQLLRLLRLLLQLQRPLRLPKSSTKASLTQNKEQESSSTAPEYGGRIESHRLTITPRNQMPSNNSRDSFPLAYGVL
jgi:hypothetical protein